MNKVLGLALLLILSITAHSEEITEAFGIQLGKVSSVCTGSSKYCSDIQPPKPNSLFSRYKVSTFQTGEIRYIGGSSDNLDKDFCQNTYAQLKKHMLSKYKLTDIEEADDGFMFIAKSQNNVKLILSCYEYGRYNSAYDKDINNVAYYEYYLNIEYAYPFIEHKPDLEGL